MLERLRRAEDALYARIGRTALGRIVNRETVSYLFWGVVTTLVNLAVYYLLLPLPFFSGSRYIYAHDAGIVAGKVSAYFANKFFVFRKKNETKGALAAEIVLFVFTRLFTFFLDHFTLRFLVEVLGGDKVIMKWISTALVVIVNYFLGKYLVFRKRSAEGESAADAAGKERS